MDINEILGYNKSSNSINGVLLRGQRRNVQMKTNWLFDNYPFIKNKELTLCKPNPTEGDAVVEIFSDKELIKLSRRTLKLDIYNVNLFFRQMEASFQSKRSVLLGIFHNENLNELLGLVLLDNIDANTECVDIDLYLRKNYRSKSLAVKAISLVTEFLFERAQVKRIAASTLAENKVFEDILLASGFTKEGVSRQGVYLPEKGVVSMAYFSFLKSDLLEEDMEAEEPSDYYL